MATTPLLDVFDAADLLAVTRRQLGSLVRKGQIPHIALPGGEIRFSESDLREWIQQHRMNGQEGSGR